MYKLGVLALFLFMLGFGFSYFVEKFDLKIFKAFPLWFFKKAIKYGNSQRSFLSLFLFIFVFNSIAICLYMLSGALIILPFLIAFLSGLYIGIIVLEPPPEDLMPASVYRPPEEVKITPYLLLLSAMVPLLELFVFCYSIAMGMEIALEILAKGSLTNLQSYINLSIALAIPRISMYLMVCVPLLFVSALAEARVIREFK
jgi:hypothetical protein